MTSTEAGPSTTPADLPNPPTPQQISQKISKLRLSLPRLISNLVDREDWTYSLREAQELLFLYEHRFNEAELVEAKAELFYVLTEANAPASGYIYDFMKVNYRSVPTEGGWRTPRANCVEVEKLENESSFIYSIEFLAQNAVFSCRPRTFRGQVGTIKKAAVACNVNPWFHLDLICMRLNEQANHYETGLPQTMFLLHHCGTIDCKKTSVQHGAPRIAFLPEPGYVPPNPQINLAGHPVYRGIQAVYQDLEAFAIRNSALASPPGNFNGAFSIRPDHIQAWQAQASLAVRRAYTARHLRDACLARLLSQPSNVAYDTSTQHPYGAPNSFWPHVPPSNGPWQWNEAQLLPPSQPHGATENTAQAQAHLSLLRDLQRDSIPIVASSTLRID